MASHTPGPWVLGECRRMTVGGFGFPVADKDGNTPAFVASWRDNAAEEGSANARLIAAAPDMLAALKAAERWMSGEGIATDALDMVRAAIARAEGRTSDEVA